MTRAARLVSPAGFGLLLLLFLLPFVAVSCDAGSAGTVEASYSGLDLAIGTEPSIEATGGLTAAEGGPFREGDRAPDPGVQVLTILTAALVVAGAAASLLRSALARALGAAGAALVATVLLIVTELAAMANLKPPILAAVESQFPGATDDLGSMLDGTLHTKAGFWLTLATLVLLLLFNIGVAVRAWVRQ